MAVGLFSFGCGSLLDAFGSPEKSGEVGANSNWFDKPSTKSCNHIQKGDKHRQGQVWRLGANTGALSHLLASSSVL